MPLNLSRLKNLSTLTEFKVGDAKGRDIKELQHLNLLRNSISIFFLEKVKFVIKAKGQNYT
jgi:hypothetical protein